MSGVIVRRVPWMRAAAVVVSAAAAVGSLAACGASDGAEVSSSPSESVAASTSSPPPEPSPSTEPSSSPTPSPEAAEPSFTDVNGRWCPTSPESWDEGCLVVDLPMVLPDAYDGVEYVYPPYPYGTVDFDPRIATQADYVWDANLGECWEASVDVFPAMSGAGLWFCPAGAVAGEEWIDDPQAYYEEVFGVSETYDTYFDQDRLYTGQDWSPYPYVRADS